mmetsp:Transcript_479/g.1132  ORF Transcript_479/g.1132 Transcript_479/m.1132 type:complete len:254 (-) Transcript_479:582-1343(-)
MLMCTCHVLEEGIGTTPSSLSRLFTPATTICNGHKKTVFVDLHVKVITDGITFTLGLFDAIRIRAHCLSKHNRMNHDLIFMIIGTISLRNVFDNLSLENFGGCWSVLKGSKREGGEIFGQVLDGRNIHVGIVFPFQALDLATFQHLVDLEELTAFLFETETDLRLEMKQFRRDLFASLGDGFLDTALFLGETSDLLRDVFGVELVCFRTFSPFFRCRRKSLLLSCYRPNAYPRTILDVGARLRELFADDEIER